ncbi:hypothetical protein [Corynebacterium sp. H113]|uniref:hypothetical protein n=1 Tax=Corynebacterium sp. H113 TaxID=3133419 RepID=UPI0030AD18EE
MAEHEGSRSGDNRGRGQGGRGGQGGNRGFGGRSGGRSAGRSGGRPGGRPGGRSGGFGGRDRRDDRGERRDDRRGGYDRDRGERRFDERRDDRRGGYDRDRPDDRGERGERRFDERGERRGGFSGGRGGRDRDDRRGFSGGRGGRDDRRGGGNRRSNRGGQRQDEQRTQRTGPQRPGFREERINARMNEPSLPDDIRADELDPAVRQDLKSLSKDNADATARHMIMAAITLAEDPQLALRHARAAKDRAGRVGVVRETAGVTAYHAGEWKEALSELRAARRISGGAGLLAVMADCERGLGRPEKAIELARSEEAKLLDADSKTELAIVVAGARRDMGQLDAALLELEQENLDPTREDFEAIRLFYAYADALAAAGRTEEAKEWFERSANLDPEEVLDSRDRIDELMSGTPSEESNEGE